MDWLNILQMQILGNLASLWLIAIGLGIGAYLILLIVKHLAIKNLARLASRTENGFDNSITTLFERTRGLFLLVVAIYIGSLLVVLPDRARGILNSTVIVIILVQAALWGLSLIDYLVNRRLIKTETEETANPTTLNAIRLVAKIVLWSVIILLILENITGIRVNSLIASLGIGGIAVALAVQNILSDLFSSLSIALDKPFVIGDVITVGEFSGTVEHIGLKSTRVRSLTGEQVVFSNSDLLSSRIRNFKSMERRRVIFTLGVTYQTPPEKLAQIPAMIEEIITAQENTTFDRSHFSAFGDFSLNFETVYFMEVADYTAYMDTQQKINLELYRRFSEVGIEFAYPTQTLFLEKNGMPAGTRQRSQVANDAAA